MLPSMIVEVVEWRRVTQWKKGNRRRPLKPKTVAVQCALLPLDLDMVAEVSSNETGVIAGPMENVGEIDIGVISDGDNDERDGHSAASKQWLGGRRGQGYLLVSDSLL